MRIFLGLIVPLIAVYLSWSIGSPPPKSVFWNTATGEITGQQTESYETGYGPADFTNPVVILESGETRLLKVENVHDAAAVEADWPAGTKIDLRLDPDGETAFSADDTANIWYAVIITAGALYIMAFFVWSFFAESGGTQLFLAGVGACFIMMPLILLRFMWTFGEPPATSLFWPKETVEVVSNEITEHPWGGGRIARKANIVVESQNGEILPLHTDGKANPTVAEFAIGSTHRVKRSPDAALFERSMRFPFFLAFFMSVMTPIFIAAGLWVISKIFVPSERV